MSTLACVRNGVLFLVRPGQEPVELSSAYAEKVRAREVALERRNAWKTQGTGARFMGMGQVLWGQGALDLPPARVTGVTRGREPGELVYAISTGGVTGLFARTPPGEEEDRLFHAADLDVSDLSLSLEHSALACALEQKGGSSAIGLLEDDGRGVQTLTEGDVVDRAPRWIPGSPRRLVYASAGIGRNRAGEYGGLSPFSIQRLSVADASVDVVVSDPKYDYLAPVPVSEDEVYAIRRPYRDPYRPPSFFRLLWDALLAPFRLVFALLQYLSFFTARYTGKPLMTSGNARQKAADAKQMLVWGNLVDVAREAGEKDDDASAAGRGYELVRITRSGVEVAVKGVLAFDVASDGAVYYSTGRAVMKLANGKTSRMATLDSVDRLVVMDTGALTPGATAGQGSG